VLSNAGTGIAITATPDPVRSGELVQYAVTVTNRTTGSLLYTISAQVPNHTTVASNAISPGGGCGGAGSCAAGVVITWGSYSIATGQSATVLFAALVDTANPPPNGTLISSTASATASGNGATAAVDVVVQGSPVCTTSGTVSGSVIDATTGQGLAGVQLSIGASFTTSGANGAFSFPSISGGVHVLVSAAPNFAGGGVVVNVCGNTTPSVLLTHNQTTFGLRALSAYSADPVNTATGNYAFARTDLKLPGKGLGFAFERSYNSLDPLNGPLGFGWTHNYNTSLGVDGGGNVTVRWGDGHTGTFAPKVGGGYTPQYGVFDTMVKEIDTSYTLTAKDLMVYRFGTDLKLLSIADRNGNTIALTYVGALLTRVTDTAGRHIDFTYDGAGRITTLTDPLSRTVQFAYDGAGNLVTSTDPARKVTSYSYDVNHQMLTATDPRGNVFVTNTYDGTKRVVTFQRDAKGGQTTYAYDTLSRQTTVNDALGQITKFTHDSLLRLIRDDDALGHSRYFSYDAAGNRTAVTDRNGNITAYLYDSGGNVTRKTDPLGNATSLTYDAHNNPLTRTDALSLVTAFNYDGKGNLTVTTDALGHTNTASYDGAGLPLTLTDARGNVTTNTYDTQGNLTQVRDALSNVTTFAYDAAGRRLSKTDALGRVTTYSYDADDNVAAITDPAGKTVSYSFDGNNNRVSTTDRLSHTTTTAYDQKDLPTTITDALGGVNASTYDPVDRKITTADPRGNVTHFAYDAAGRLIQATDAP
jgi:YD repeat-containing protein